MNNTMDVLAHSLLFSGLPADQLGQIADIAVTRKFARTATVFHEGDRLEVGAYGELIITINHAQKGA